jgi:uncharacterized membrane protein YobD (UPF0266 family)
MTLSSSTLLSATSIYEEVLEEGKIKTTALGGIYINMRFYIQWCRVPLCCV